MNATQFQRNVKLGKIASAKYNIRQAKWYIGLAEGASPDFEARVLAGAQRNLGWARQRLAECGETPAVRRLTAEIASIEAATIRL
jgi:hypothetical protein